MAKVSRAAKTALATWKGSVTDVFVDILLRRRRVMSFSRAYKFLSKLTAAA